MPTTAKSSTTDRVRALHDRLAAEVEALVTGEDWARFLSVAARFHSYSTGGSAISKLGELPSMASELNQHREVVRFCRMTMQSHAEIAPRRGSRVTSKGASSRARLGLPT